MLTAAGYCAWLVNSVRLLDVLTVPTLAFEPKAGRIFLSCTNLTSHLKFLEISECFSCNSACHDEIIVSLLGLYLSARTTWLTVFHLLSWILKRVLDKVAVYVARRCLKERGLLPNQLFSWYVYSCKPVTLALY